jgi:hypothetical protein
VTGLTRWQRFRLALNGPETRAFLLETYALRATPSLNR